MTNDAPDDNKVASVLDDLANAMASTDHDIAVSALREGRVRRSRRRITGVLAAIMLIAVASTVTLAWQWARPDTTSLAISPSATAPARVPPTVEPKSCGKMNLGPRSIAGISISKVDYPERVPTGTQLSLRVTVSLDKSSPAVKALTDPVPTVTLVHNGNRVTAINPMNSIHGELDLMPGQATRLFAAANLTQCDYFSYPRPHPELPIGTYGLYVGITVKLPTGSSQHIVSGPFPITLF